MGNQILIIDVIFRETQKTPKPKGDLKERKEHLKKGGGAKKVDLKKFLTGYVHRKKNLRGKAQK